MLENIIRNQLEYLEIKTKRRNLVRDTNWKPSDFLNIRKTHCGAVNC